ncbi:glycosyltransferase, partial [bacterium]|nr:glycosyltransferase [bacterium]
EIQNELQILCSRHAGNLGIQVSQLAAISQRILHSLENQGRIILLTDESLNRLPEVLTSHIRSVSGFPVNAGPIIGMSPVPNEWFIEFTVGRTGNVNDVCLAITGPSISNEFIHVLKTAHEKRIATALFAPANVTQINLPIKKISITSDDGMDIWGMKFSHYLAAFMKLVFPNGAEEIHQMELGWEKTLAESNSIQLQREVETPKVSIVLPTRNRFDEAKRSIKNFSEKTSVTHEIIVVDDSSDGSYNDLQEEFYSASNIYILHNEVRQGLQPSINLGLALCRGDYVVTLTDDLNVYPGWESALIHLLENEPLCGIATPLILEADNTIQSMGVIDGARSWKHPALPPVFGAKGWIGRGRTREQCPESRWARECDYGCISFMRRELMYRIRG